MRLKNLESRTRITLLCSINNVCSTETKKDKTICHKHTFDSHLRLIYSLLKSFGIIYNLIYMPIEIRDKSIIQKIFKSQNQIQYIYNTTSSKHPIKYPNILPIVSERLIHNHTTSIRELRLHFTKYKKGNAWELRPR